MTANVDSIVNGFPHPTIPPIMGIPTYATIAEVNLKLNANTASVKSALSNEALGLLALTVSLAVYATLSDVPFVVPINPGPQPDIPVGATGPQIAAITCAHNEDLRIWQEYMATDKHGIMRT
jgi:hypothetical protein